MKLLAYIGSLLIATGALAQDARFSFKESYTLSSSPQVAISSSDGDIEVVNIEGPNTDVFFIVKKQNKVLSMNRAALEKELELTVEKTDNSLNIVVKYPNSHGIMDWKDRVTVSFRVQTPKGTTCDLRTSDGNISITGLSRDQKMRTSDGNIHIENIQGSVWASTSDGNIEAKHVGGAVELKTSDGDIKVNEVTAGATATTSDGNITITKAKGDVKAKTSDGDINFQDLDGALTASTSDGNIKGNIQRLTKELSAHTSDGNISISVPANLGLDLDIKGESIDVPLTNFSGRSDEKHVQGKSNGGGIHVNLSTSGNVRLVYN
ncbi:DUF4097 family beta strand repeat-containing protein [Chryseolinea sp. T2]|uniref:DUF4097 family beta strand repeat-containing protein n=1 Tax=Chryseolinea sp. T2 TaxID=3129255 RepID=UPI0030771D66